MRPIYLEIAHPNGFTQEQYDKIVKFAGQPVDLLALIDTDVPFMFLGSRRGQSNDFVVIDYPYEV